MELDVVKDNNQDFSPQEKKIEFLQGLVIKHLLSINSDTTNFDVLSMLEGSSIHDTQSLGYILRQYIEEHPTLLEDWATLEKPIHGEIKAPPKETVADVADTVLKIWEEKNRVDISKTVH